MTFEDAPGRVIDGRYELVEKIGEGGMAAVWRALAHGALGFRREVTVKRILPELHAFPDFARMFVEEARVGSQLVHPNIVQIFDFGVDEDDLYFLVGEYVDGLDLREWARAHRESGRAAPWTLVTALAIEILRGLAAAHAHRDAHGKHAPIYHRDVSPQNVLISVDGIIKLTDFGLARAMDRTRTTRPDVVKGKLGYLAPELAWGEAATARSDLYAVGVVIWEVLAGRRLFDAQTDFEVLRLVRDPRVTPLIRLRPEIPAQLHAVVMRALDPDPARRFASADEMRHALAKILRGRAAPVDSAVIGRSVVELRAELALQLEPDDRAAAE